jgi:hypothetical protein
VALSPQGIVPIKVSLQQRGASDGLVVMDDAAMAASSREAALTGVLCSLLHYDKLCAIMDELKSTKPSFHGLWHLAKDYTFRVTIPRMEVEGNSLGMAVAMAVVTLLVGVPIRPHFGITGAVRRQTKACCHGAVFILGVCGCVKVHTCVKLEVYKGGT